MVEDLSQSFSWRGHAESMSLRGTLNDNLDREIPGFLPSQRAIGKTAFVVESVDETGTPMEFDEESQRNLSDDGRIIPRRFSDGE